MTGDRQITTIELFVCITCTVTLSYLHAVMQTNIYIDSLLFFYGEEMTTTYKI